MQSPVSSFAGRTRELEELHEMVLNEQNRRQITVISGLGGMGKSELAKMYAHLKGPACFNGNVVWIEAENKTSLINSFVSLGQYLGVHEKELTIAARVAKVYDFFKDKESLFIFDNVQGISLISQFIPVVNPVKKSPHVIVTSQVSDWEESVMIQHLENLNEYEAVCLIMNSLNNIKIVEADAKLLANELQCFPLALQQAIAYIKKSNKRRKFTVNDYIVAFECKAKELLDIQIPEHTRTVFVTLSMTFERLKGFKNYQLAMDVITTMAFMHADGIPFGTFLEFARNDEDQLWDALELLEQYSLIHQTKDDMALKDDAEVLFRIHRLVRCSSFFLKFISMNMS